MRVDDTTGGRLLLLLVLALPSVYHGHGVPCHDYGRAPSLPPHDDQEQVQQLWTEINSWMKHPFQNDSNVPCQISQVAHALNGSVEFHNPDRVHRGQDGRCSACRAVAKFAIGYLKVGGPPKLILKLLIAICYVAFYRNLSVCRGLLQPELDSLTYILRYGSVSGDQLCSMLLSSSFTGQTCGFFRGPRWSVILPKSAQQHRFARASDHRRVRRSAKAQFLVNRHRSLSTTFIDKSKSFTRLFNEGLPYLKVLHLTDIHFDPKYVEGAASVCNAPICCTKQSGRARHPSEAAGKWGDYGNCDSPRILIENMLYHISRHHPDIDYIMWTGDSVPHDIWQISRRSNTFVISELGKMVHESFPGVPIYGSVGNHETYPRDSFAPAEIPAVWQRFGNKWLYDLLARQWQSYVPNIPINPNVRITGCYSMPVRKDFRIISINTNFCYKFNLWTLYKSVDPGNVLRWLVAELVKAESNGEYVHIIGHIAPLYSDCYEEWGHQFNRIVSRFSHVIRAQFYGHCHRDEVRIHFDVRNPKLPIGHEYLTPSNGPYKGLNPSFRIFYVDGDHPRTNRVTVNAAIIDYETYFMNLTHANLYDDPRWQLLYRGRQELGMRALEAKDWDGLAHRMARNTSLANNVFRYHVHASDRELRKGCGEACQYQLVCNMVDGDKFLPKKCRSLLP